MNVQPSPGEAARTADAGLSFLDLLLPLVSNLRPLLIAPLAAGLLALGVTYLVAPTYTATTSFLPPQQQQSAAASALASLGALTGLPSGGTRTMADQFVALMQSTTVSDRIIEKAELLSVYEVDFKADARRLLTSSVRISVGKKDGLVSVEVDDKSPQRAAAIANHYVDELRRLTSALAVTEAQQRRRFFEAQLQQTRDKLAQAQTALQASGFSQGALRAEPRAAAEAYARLRAETTAAEVRLQTMRATLADGAPEVTQAQNALAALRGQLSRLEATAETGSGADYVGKYREFKYQETLFDLFARQYELARVDESREGALIQVVDTATPPEKKSKPQRRLIAMAAALATAVLMVAFLVVRSAWQQAARDSDSAPKVARLRAALRRR